MAMNIDDVKMKAIKFYNDGTSTADSYRRDIQQRAGAAYGILSRQVVILKSNVVNMTTNAVEKDYGPRTMLLLFAIPVIGNIFYIIKELDYHKKLVDALKNDQWDKVAIVINLKNEMIQSHLAATTVKVVLYAALGALTSPLVFIYTASVTFQVLRLTDNEEALENANNELTLYNMTHNQIHMNNYKNYLKAIHMNNYKNYLKAAF